jgi:hypothetical protein
MKLPWSLCPYCGTPEPGKRIEDLTFSAATRNLEVEEVENDQPEDEIFEDSKTESVDKPDLEELSDEDLISKL